jgi:hypothetical protein
VSGSIVGGGITVNVDAREDPPEPEPRWRSGGRSLLGGTVAGLAANILGGAYPLASSIGVAAAATFVIIAAVQLRQLPTQAPIQRIVARSSLGIAAITVVASLLVPAGLTGWTVLLAAAFGMIGVLTPAPFEHTIDQASGACFIGISVSFCGYAVHEMAMRPLFGLGMLGASIGMVGVGLSILLDRSLLHRISVVVSGASLGGLGAVAVREWSTTLAILCGVTGLALVVYGCVGTARLADHLGALGVGSLGVLNVAIGLELLAQQQAVLGGASLISLGLSLICFSVAYWLDLSALSVVSTGVMGASFIGLGIAGLQVLHVLFSVAAAIAGAASVVLAGWWVWPRVSARIRRLMTDPSGAGPAGPTLSPTAATDDDPDG